MPLLPATKDSAPFADFLSILWTRKTLVFLITGLVVLTTLAITVMLPRWYLLTAEIRVEKPEGEVKLFQAQSNAYYDPYFIQDQLNTIQSDVILKPVIDHLGLNEVLGRQLNNGEPLRTNLTQAFLLDKMLRVESRRSSSIIEIGVFAREPVLAARIANEIARVYSENRIAFATSGQREGLEELQRQLSAQEEAVSKQRDLVEKLRKDLNISGVDLNARYSDMEIDRLRQMQNSLIALRVDTIGRKTRWERFKSIPFDERLMPGELRVDPGCEHPESAAGLPHGGPDGYPPQVPPGRGPSRPRGGGGKPRQDPGTARWFVERLRTGAGDLV